MLASVAFGTANTGKDVYYRILNSDKTVYLARTNVGVTELVASSGSYGVELDDADIAGKTIVWDIDGTNKTAPETFAFEMYTVEAMRTTVWNAVTRTLTAALGHDDIDAITVAIIDALSGQFSVTGRIVVGRGRGSTLYTDTVLANGHPVEHVTVKAYAKVTGVYDWDHLLAMDTTDNEGHYTFYLNPGTYIVSIEKGYTQITTVEITVT
jgi:hypothetical protein